MGPHADAAFQPGHNVARVVLWHELECDTGADHAAAGRPQVLVAPALPYGSSGEHAAFPGTLSLGRAVDRLRLEGRATRAWAPTLRGDGDAHAGRVETSLILAIAPDAVGPLRPVGAIGPISALMPALRAGGVGAVSANGVLGDARPASRREGETLLAELAADLGAFLDAARPLGAAT